MSDAERLLKELGLDFKELTKDKAWKIKPLDFMSNIYIVLVDEDTEFSMFIWKNESIQKECKFKNVANITDVYSFLYNYDKQNLKNKNELTRTNT